MLCIVTATKEWISQLSIKWEEHSSTWISQDILVPHLEARVQVT